MYDKQSSPFEAPESIEKVYMTGNISNIGDSTFADMSSLSSIVIPDSVESIGNNAFSGCTGLESVGYSGSEQAWNNVWIGEGNEALGDVQFNVKPSVPGLVIMVQGPAELPSQAPEGAAELRGQGERRPERTGVHRAAALPSPERTRS